MKFAGIIGSIVLVTSVSSFALIDLRIGGGLNLSNEILSGDYKLPDYIYKPMHVGFNAGVRGALYFPGSMGIAVGINYETRGSGLKVDQAKLPAGDDVYNPPSMEFSMNYLQVPVLLLFRVVPGLAVGLGPELGFFLSGKTKIGDESMDIDKIKTVDLGASLTVDYTILNMVAVGAGYYFGFFNNDGRSSADVMQGSDRNTNIKIYAAYVFHLL